MTEYRKTLDLDSEASYHFVEPGPIPGYPSWHEQASPSCYAFPTPEAAERFAAGARERHPDREVSVRG